MKDNGGDMADNNQWEYRVGSIGTFWSYPNDEGVEQLFNEWGEDGWEVIIVTPEPNSNKLHVVAKRPLTAANRRRRSYPGSE